jgi:hypothetical protein
MTAHVPRCLSAVRPRGGLLVAIVVLSLGLTGCYTQLRMTSDAPAAEGPRAEQTSPETAPTDADTDRRSAARFDPSHPVASLRRADPGTTADLVSLAKALQRARANTEISFAEYRDGVRFFQTNYPSFYGNYFGDPFYATYDVQYHSTARAAWIAGLDVNPLRDFRDITAFLCAPHGYDPAFGCQSWAYRPSDFFFLPDVFALSGLAGASYADRFLWGSPYHSRYGGRGGWGLGHRSPLYGFRSPYGYGGLYGYGSGLSATMSADGSDAGVEGRREVRPRRGTVGRGGARAGAGNDTDRSSRGGARTDRGRLAEGRSGRAADERERPSRSARTEPDDRDRSGASEMRGDAIRRPQMLVAPVFSGGDEARALAEVEKVALETVRVTPPSVEGRDRRDALRTYQALQRIAETTDGRSVSIEHRDEMSSVIRHLSRVENRYRSENRRGDRYRGGKADRRDYGASRRSSSGREVRSTRDRGHSASGQSRSDRGSRNSSGRDRSRAGSGDDGGRR